ncbi:RNA polymerase recycling motor HelD [Ectobacillus ponti]|uniref:UvrD-helicase domain-containing protein n=1 Tax=Ectobacillus ponti TaxID=2961894 RepID=A0AA42BMY1_9BACI|nr:RNA polymerase recycling motor HelD [Ectobacillus ponti]MCP8967360.1 UvrD-helicase domain-containing protein [Ectobacillus ponti]
MNIHTSDLEQEQQRVRDTAEKIHKQAALLTEQLGGVKAEAVQLRKNFWEDVTVNFSNTDEATETMASIKQQAELLSERERSHRHAQLQLKTLKRLEQSPYFGRIDFQEEGDSSPEQIYLGIGSFYDEETQQFLVYDWRAPISSLYYDYGVGPARYEAPGGMITGDMLLKRQFVIRFGRIRSMFDTGITIGDELLQEVLGEHADTQMRSIVATIQREQNQIIRNEKGKLLVVQGAAGSGKTSAALQRVAYLLYRYRHVLRADQILLFSPNPLFNSYISTVLPELGEENMQQTTLQEYLEHELGDVLRLEDPFVQLEYVLTEAEAPGYEARLEGIRYKAGFAFMEQLERYAKRLLQGGMLFRDILFRGRVMISTEQISAKFYEMDPSWRIPNRLQHVARWLLEELKQRERRERRKAWVEEEVQLLDQEAYVKVHQHLQKKKRYSDKTFDDFGREEKLLGAYVVRNAFRPVRAAVKQFEFIDVPGMYAQLFADPAFALELGELPGQWPDICRQTLANLKQGELLYEDATPYLYFQELVEGFQRNMDIRHVFIDEAQDYSPFQAAFLKKLFPNAKLTVLGDFNQAIHAHAARAEGSAFEGLYEAEQTERIVLTRSYRSTRPIIEFTSQLISGGSEIEPFQRAGRKPVIMEAEAAKEESIIRLVEQLRQDDYETIAIICKTARTSRIAHAAIGGQLGARLIHKETVSFERGIAIIPAYLAKGVEFDAVIIYDGNDYGQERERKLFYTACTRAMHELYVYARIDTHPFLKHAAADTYVKG